jgi:hypothetical protein
MPGEVIEDRASDDSATNDDGPVVAAHENCASLKRSSEICWAAASSHCHR